MDAAAAAAFTDVFDYATRVVPTHDFAQLLCGNSL